jgi:CRP-like cAMP-binding protein
MSGIAQAHCASRLLGALPAEEYERLGPNLETVSLSTGQILFRPDDHIHHVYFPTTAVVSLITDLEEGAGMELGLIGKEGMAGTSAILGGSEMKLANVQGQGAALKLRADKLREEFNRGGALQSILLRYVYELMTQMSLSVVCNTRHNVEGRLARWLLMFSDRVDSEKFELTHELIANMLGVRRASVTEVANHLQHGGLIHYQRGHIAILNRKRLEEFACECYPAMKESFCSFLP